MKRALAAVLALTVLFCGCAGRTPIEDSFMPSVMGVEAADGGFVVTLAGYVPGETQDDAPGVRKETRLCGTVAQIDTGEVELGLLSCVVAGESCFEGGLYRVYSPVIYDGAACEDARIVAAADASALLDMGEGDLDALLDAVDHSPVPAPSVLSYDIAMRTPGAACLVPVLEKTDGGFAVVSAAVFIGDAYVYSFRADELETAALITGGTVETVLYFELDNGERGACSATLSASVSARYAEGILYYDVAVTGEARVSGREKGHENLFLTSDASQLEEALEQSVADACAQTIARAYETCGRDVFNFGAAALARYRRQLEETIETFSSENTRVSVTAHLEIRNLSQMH